MLSKTVCVTFSYNRMGTVGCLSNSLLGGGMGMNVTARPCIMAINNTTYNNINNKNITHDNNNNMFFCLFDPTSLPLGRLPGVCSGGKQGILQRL